MPFKKNDENINRNGRPRGKGNKTTEDLREAIKQFCEDKLPEMEKTWAQLSAKERAGFYEQVVKAHIAGPG
ncbi:MAG: hypothetical protein U5K32_12905 [Bacteroidales bacterium]|nr:hypothetical protein [Bacteroidales bacterium]